MKKPQVSQVLVFVHHTDTAEVKLLNLKAFAALQIWKTI